MPSSAAEIEAMLDAVAAKQIRCPECGLTDDLYYIYPNWRIYPAYPLFDGSIAYSDSQDDDSSEPTIPEVQAIPHIFACGNVIKHPESNPGGTTTWKWLFFGVPKTVTVDYNHEAVSNGRGWTA